MLFDFAISWFSILNYKNLVKALEGIKFKGSGKS